MQITIDLPKTLQLTETDLCTELADSGCEAIALFQQQRITLGSTSQLARLHQIEFQQLISDRGICIHDEVKDLEQDLTSLHRDGW
jgi:predicted HTH domain antitoxin